MGTQHRKSDVTRVTISSQSQHSNQGHSWSHRPTMVRWDKVQACWTVIIISFYI